ncbi:hypothetical protein [Qipengyuania spongiae]|uniref:Uncharacterized protein n=1 Tax=Qipengyuania spongiae TaxID=2909673 RepID=A0ABY5SXH1_9SPHN|nr:hypothetical protein [Qipengyuania spongiae]UVI39237.1 hypothetical protein L1F33_13555 [Qipengyuania spongiae]
MSSKGEIVPELAELLREIADRIDAREATKRDARKLRKIANEAAGDDPEWTLKIHARRGAPRHSVDRRFAMAEAIQAYRAEHGTTIENACNELCGQFNVGPDRMMTAWKEMRSILRTDEGAREVRLMFHELMLRQGGKK